MRKYLYILACSLCFLGITSCDEEWLTPDPLSFFTPDNTFTTPEGLQATLTTCERNLRYTWVGDGTPIISELIFSEICVEGTTDKASPAQNLNLIITPSSNLNSNDYNKIGWFWYEGYKGIKYANTVISNAPHVPGLDPTVRDQMIAQALFHRSFRYYFLTLQFGDIIYFSQEVKSPKVDFYSTKYDVILKQCVKDMEWAVEHAPVKPDLGRVSKGACQHLLAKLYLATGDFDKAITSCSQLIDGGTYKLMKNRFGVDKSKTDKNITWDLHRPLNKGVWENTEQILVAIDREDYEQSREETSLMRQAVPFYPCANQNRLYTPAGGVGLVDSYTAKIDLRKMYGRGIGRARGTWYSTNMIWDDTKDLRHAPGNWMNMSDLVYNNGALEGKDPYYGKPLELYDKNGKILTTDTIRNWFSWPHYKLYVEDPKKDNNDQYNGGAGDMYIYRLAETYLMRAEAYFWKGELQKAADDVNAIRTRAGASAYPASKIDMGTILDERARELFWEELRHVELVRISRLFCMTGKAAENGKTYEMENFSENNYWYDRIMSKTDFYNKGVKTVYGNIYTMSPYHALWPVPQKSIDSNTEGRLNQNYGYAGYELNEPPFDNIEDAIKSELAP